MSPVRGSADRLAHRDHTSPREQPWDHVEPVRRRLLLDQTRKGLGNPHCPPVSPGSPAAVARDTTEHQPYVLSVLKVVVQMLHQSLPRQALFLVDALFRRCERVGYCGDGSPVYTHVVELYAEGMGGVYAFL